jgi:hypothetical protein
LVLQVTELLPLLSATVLPLTTIRQLTRPPPVELTLAVDPDRTVTELRAVAVLFFVWCRTTTLPLDFLVLFPLFTVEWLLPLVLMSSGSHAVSARTAAAATPTTAARLVNMALSVRPGP